MGLDQGSVLSGAARPPGRQGWDAASAEERSLTDTHRSALCGLQEQPHDAHVCHTGHVCADTLTQREQEQGWQCLALAWSGHCPQQVGSDLSLSLPRGCKDRLSLAGRAWGALSRAGPLAQGVVWGTVSAADRPCSQLHRCGRRGASRAGRRGREGAVPTSGPWLGSLFCGAASRTQRPSWARTSLSGRRDSSPERSCGQGAVQNATHRQSSQQQARAFRSPTLEAHVRGGCCPQLPSEELGGQCTSSEVTFLPIKHCPQCSDSGKLNAQIGQTP